MIDWLLQRVEQHPDAVFAETELVARSAQQFAALRRERLIRRVPQPPLRTWLPPTGGPPLRVIHSGDRLLAIDPWNREADPIPISAADLVEWEVDLEQILVALAKVNSLHGRPGRITERLHLAGDAYTNGETVAVVLALLPNDATAHTEMAALANRLTHGYHQFVAVCPSYIPGPQTLRWLEGLQIQHVTLDRDDPLHIPLSGVETTARPRAPLVTLTEAEAREAQRHGFRFSRPIQISGRVEKRSRNSILVGDREVTLTGEPFLLFLRLVVAAFEEDGGWYDWQRAQTGPNADREWNYAPANLSQTLLRVQQPFEDVVKPLRRTEFIERKSNRVRISMHPRLLLYGRDALADHPDERIRRLAGRLPPCPDGMSLTK